jgi:hypothetical protein
MIVRSTPYPQSTKRTVAARMAAPDNTGIGSTKSVDASGNRAERSPVLTSTAPLRWILPVRTGNLSTTATSQVRLDRRRARLLRNPRAGQMRV